MPKSFTIHGLPKDERPPCAEKIKELPRIIITDFGLSHNRLYHKHINMPKSIYSKEYRTTIEKLIKARHEAGLSQVEVATKLGKPQSYVSKIERGERRIDIAELKKLASIYQKTTSYFID